MGVLDDAIRDHLDLKRRHGADQEEIERAEREALGPIRRGPDEGEAPGDDFEEPFAHDQDEQAGWEEPSAREPAGAAPVPEQEEEGVFDHAADPDEAPTTIQRPVERPQAEPAEEPSREEKPFAEDDPFAEEEPFPEERAPATPPPHAAPPEPTGDETAEYNVEEALGERGHKDEDVLEETPDFLQDAPDHDRLWFEQRPPKDFDFND